MWSFELVITLTQPIGRVVSIHCSSTGVKSEILGPWKSGLTLRITETRYPKPKVSERDACK